MQIAEATALVTGANRGLGRHIARELRDRGARVFAAARDPRSIDLADVTPVALDITDPASVAAAAAQVQDVSILINNAGISTGSSLLTGKLQNIRAEFEVNFFGTLAVTRAFAPQLARRPEGYVLNVLSVLSWLSLPHTGGYSASKSAAWALTNALRQELAAQNTRVGALHVGYMDTDMAAKVDAAKLDPAEVARIAVDAVAARESEVVADQLSADVRRALAGGVAALYPQHA